MATNRFLNTVNIQAILVSEGTGTAANSDWVSMANYASCIFAPVLEDGATGNEVIFTVEQAKDNTGADKKVVAVRRFFLKEHATALSSAGTYSEVAPVSNGVEVTGTSENIVLVEVGEDELDVAGGFTFLALAHDNGGATTKLVTAVAILCGPNYALAPDNLPAVNV